jgi:LysR family transcriptional activator of nhaA
MAWLNYHHLRYFWTAAREGSVSRAAKQLRLSQPTVSEQLHELEGAFGEKLFRRGGKGIVLTEAGTVVFRYADEIFTLGRDLEEALSGRAPARARRLSVGVADVIPKAVAQRLLAPALTAGAHLVCREDRPERLLASLATHDLDVVLVDAPVGPAHEGRAHNHLLGECGVSIFGATKLATKARRGFPRSLEGMPLLVPTTDSALRRGVDAWLDGAGIAVKVVAEVQDTALLVAFAESGVGLFAGPDAIAAPMKERGVVRVGAVPALRERYYAVTVERRIRHPAVVAIAGAARAVLAWPARQVR